MVIIGYDYNGTIISILNAKTEDLALAYWQGAGIMPHHHRNLNDTETFESIENHVTGVYPILKTTEIEAYRLKDYKGNVRLVKK